MTKQLLWDVPTLLAKIYATFERDEFLSDPGGWIDYYGFPVTDLVAAEAIEEFAAAPIHLVDPDLPDNGPACGIDDPNAFTSGSLDDVTCEACGPIADEVSR